MLNSINYEKYENMSKRSLFNSLLKEEKKASDLQNKIKEQMSLISYLKTKVKSVIDETSYTLESSPAMKEIRKEFESLPKDEQEQIRAEMLLECGLNENNY